jgi:AcrR family transcriptional regulator
MAKTIPEQPFVSRAKDDRSTAHNSSYNQRNDAILKAATTLIARDGYEKASMRAVAAEAGISPASMYHYFDGKEAMLFTILFRAFSGLESNLRMKTHLVEDPLEQMRIMISEHVLFFANDMDGLKLCSHELDSMRGKAYEELHRIRRSYYHHTREIVNNLINKYDLRVNDPHVATMSLFSSLNWLYRWYDPFTSSRSPAVLGKLFFEQFIGGLSGSELLQQDNGEEQ